MELIFSVLLLALTASASALKSTDVLGSDHKIHRYWPRWSGIKHMIVFGDSYTETGFDVHGPQPSLSNPLGNPDYPGYTSSNGPNWIDYLTTTYNKTFVQTINLAYGGATVDQALIPQHRPTILSVKNQINDEYLTTYANHPSFFDWRSEDTLFAIFVGINDISNAYGWSNSSTVFPEVIAQYSSLVNKLYRTGAKNFLFLNVPPVDRSPQTKARGQSAQAAEKKAIASWNSNVAGIAAKLKKTHKSATTFVFDTNALYNQVLDNPRSYRQTAPYKDTTNYCQPNTKCEYKPDEYFWLNDLHPTSRIHEVTAQQIAKRLS